MEEESPYPPLSPDFHGFGPGTVMPRRLVLETAGEGEDDEHLVNVHREVLEVAGYEDEEGLLDVQLGKKTGRPKGAKPELWGTCAGAIDTLNCIGWKRREPDIDGESSSPHPSTSLAPYTPPASSPKPRPSRGTGTASRKKLFLLDMVEDTFLSLQAAQVSGCSACFSSLIGRYF